MTAPVPSSPVALPGGNTRQDERPLCVTIDCGFPATVRGVYDDGDSRYRGITYCDPCAKTVGYVFTASERIAASPVPDDGTREAVVAVLRQHHPIMRSETGPLSGCRCGQVRLGEDVIAHVVDQLLAVVHGTGGQR